MQSDFFCLSAPAVSAEHRQQLPERSQMETLIRSAEGIVSLRQCTVFVRLINRPGRPAVSFDQIRNSPFVLPVSGRHEFRLVRKNSREA